jgi:hypothetical protein
MRQAGRRAPQWQSWLWSSKNWRSLAGCPQMSGLPQRQRRQSGKSKRLRQRLQEHSDGIE